MGRESAAQTQGGQGRAEGETGLPPAGKQGQQGGDQQQDQGSGRHPSSEAYRFHGGNRGHRQRGRTAENQLSQRKGRGKQSGRFLTQLGMHVQRNCGHQQRGQGYRQKQKNRPLSFHVRQTPLQSFAEVFYVRSFLLSRRYFVCQIAHCGWQLRERQTKRERKAETAFGCDLDLKGESRHDMLKIESQGRK